MEDVLFKRISSDPRYIELKRKRTRFGWWLTLSMMVVYYGFIVLVAFDKELLFRRLGAGGLDARVLRQTPASREWERRRPRRAG